MENKALHKLGIDIGSTTVKIAVLDAQDKLLFSDYERHFANIQETSGVSHQEGLRPAWRSVCIPNDHRFRRTDTRQAS